MSMLNYIQYEASYTLLFDMNMKQVKPDYTSYTLFSSNSLLFDMNMEQVTPSMLTFKKIPDYTNVPVFSM